MLSADDAGPYDRPNLSKDYLAGTAPAEWIPLRSLEFYAEHEIELKLGTRAAAIDTNAREVRLADGTELHYGALLLATGAVPVRLNIPGSDLSHIHCLRTLADSRVLVAAGTAARRAVEMQERGFRNVGVLAGGFLAWILEGYDVTTIRKDAAR